MILALGSHIFAHDARSVSPRVGRAGARFGAQTAPRRARAAVMAAFAARGAAGGAML